MEAKLIVGGEVIRTSRPGWLFEGRKQDTLARGIYLIGRPGQNEGVAIWGPGHENGDYISEQRTNLKRKHLALQVWQDRVVLSDLNTGIGSYVNGLSFDEKQLPFAGEYDIRLGDHFFMDLIITE